MRRQSAGVMPWNTGRGVRGESGTYTLNLPGILENLARCAEGTHPVRLVGFPSYTYFYSKK